MTTTPLPTTEAELPNLRIASEEALLALSVINLYPSARSGASIAAEAKLRTALASQPQNEGRSGGAVQVPAGYALVLIEPTPKMRGEGRETLRDAFGDIGIEGDDATNVWQAMLAASPVPPAPADPKPADVNQDLLVALKDLVEIDKLVLGISGPFAMMFGGTSIPEGADGPLPRAMEAIARAESAPAAVVGEPVAWRYLWPKGDECISPTWMVTTDQAILQCAREDGLPIEALGVIAAPTSLPTPQSEGQK